MAQRVERRSQEERSEATRAQVLDAAITCLVDYGYSSSPTTRIAEQAGVSRGGQLHHFPTKAILFSEAIGHLARERLAQLERDAAAQPHNTDRTRAALELLWGTFSGPLFQAALELWVAARTDEELRRALAPMEREIGRRILEVAREIFSPEHVARSDFETLLLVSFNCMRGIAAVQCYEADAVRRERHWRGTREVLAALFERTG